VGPRIFNLYWLEIVCLLSLFAVSLLGKARAVTVRYALDGSHRAR
jgi:hypothetical protein